MIPGRFSFLLDIPAIGAAGLFELRDLLKQGLEVAGFPTLRLAFWPRSSVAAWRLISCCAISAPGRCISSSGSGSLSAFSCWYFWRLESCTRWTGATAIRGNGRPALTAVVPPDTVNLDR